MYEKVIENMIILHSKKVINDNKKDGTIESVKKEPKKPEKNHYQLALSIALPMMPEVHPAAYGKSSFLFSVF